MIELVFFHAYPDHLKKQLPVGQKRVISGKIERFHNNLQMTHPDFIVAPEEASAAHAILRRTALALGDRLHRVAAVACDPVGLGPARSVDPQSHRRPLAARELRHALKDARHAPNPGLHRAGHGTVNEAFIIRAEPVHGVGS